jgi:HAE1 family hydrophobic/amphiphilic exporter-1
MVQVVEAINRSGLDLPAGKVQTEKESNSVRLTGKFTSIEDIKNVQVAMPVLGSPVYVKDIADVIDGVKETTSISRYNGKNGIGLMLKKQGDANAVDVSKAVRGEISIYRTTKCQFGCKIYYCRR